MATRLAELWRQAWTFLSEGMWRAELQPRTWTARGVALLQFGVMVGEGFVRDRLLLRASALTYFTALSLIPVLVLVSAILTAVGVTDDVVGGFAEQVEARFPGVGTQLLEFVARANPAGLGTVGAATAFLVTLLGISNIEGALNHIWGVTQSRSWARKIPDYLAVVVVAPLLLVVGLSLATTVKSQWIVERLLTYPAFEGLYALGLQLPVVVLVTGFTFVYWFLPNTRVRPFAAFLGGVAAGVAVNAALGGYLQLGVGAARASAFYGGLAQFPLFFIFVYFFWALVLCGAEISFAYQNLELYRREVRGERAGAAEREAIGLRIALEIARSFRDGTPPLSTDDLSDALQVPVRTVRSVLAALQARRIVVALDGSEREDSWQLGRAAERVQLLDVLAILRGPREPSRGDARVTASVESLLAELAEGEAKAAGGQTLADLLARIPSAS